MPKWQIESDDYLNRIHLSKEDFREKLCLPDLDRVARVIPLRDLKVIHSIIPITLEMVLYLVRRIKTLDGRESFANAYIRMIKVDPRHLRIGQKYVYRENYQNLLEDVSDKFQRFLVTNGGLADLAAYFIFGFDEVGDYCMSCYMPPMIEKHGSSLVIMDGIHRNFIVRQSGLTMNAILIEGVDLPFPCGLRDWGEIKVIPLSEKPKDLNDRYFDLQKNLFRDLKFLGIDG